MPTRTQLRTAQAAAILGVLGASCTAPEPPRTTHWVFFGTGADHIYVSSFNAESGALGEPRPAAAIGRPGFLALHPAAKLLYAVGREAQDGGPVGFAAAYEVNPEDGSLRELNRVPTAGRGASHVEVSPSGRALAAVNYGDGNTVSLTVEPSGALGELVSAIQHTGSSVHPQRQQEPHPHSANFTPDGNFVVVPDLGTDRLLIYSVDPQTARLEPRPEAQVALDPGSGPRHLTFHPNGRWAYGINELASTVTLLNYDPERGTLEARQTVSTLPEGYDGPANTTAEVLVHPSGRFLYGSNRGSNTIAVFAVEPADGRLTSVERVPTGGDWPRNFRLAPDGRYLLVANQRSDDVHVFSVDSNSGRLLPKGAKVTVPQPMCVKFVPTT